MKSFPFSRLETKEATITSQLAYNPFCHFPPKVRWAIGIEIAPLTLGSDAAMPEFESVVDGSIILDDLELGIQNWRELEREFTFFGENQNGSFYVSSAHNPVDARKLTFKRLEGARFLVDAAIDVAFEHEGTGYKDEFLKVAFPALYEGFRFSVPEWSTSSKVEFPADWLVPSAEPAWSDQQIFDFVEKHMNLSAFGSVNIENGRYLECKP